MSGHDTEELLTVQDFANRYLVQASVVRYWARMGYIEYVLVGPRHLRRIKKSQLVSVIPPGPAAKGVLLGEFDDYSWSDTYMRCKQSEEIKDVIEQRRETGARQGSVDKSISRKQKKIQQRDAKRTRHAS